MHISWVEIIILSISVISLIFSSFVFFTTIKNKNEVRIKRKQIQYHRKMELLRDSKKFMN